MLVNIGRLHVCAPVQTDKLQFQKWQENCEWGCESDIDGKLRICEALCHLETQHDMFQHEHETRCQEVCASKYVQCLGQCTNITSKIVS